MNQYSIEKVANAIVYFVESDMEHFGKTKLMKLMYFADKSHLENYGRTIFFDDYYKLPRGPVASLTLNIINNLNEEDGEDFKSYTDEFLRILDIKIQMDEGQKITKFIPKTTFNHNLFSKSEMKVLEAICQSYKYHKKDEISHKSHSLREYINTQMNSIIDIADMVADEESKNYITFWQNEHKQFHKMLQDS
jgi:uncharacterized phage-associated protein